MNDEELAGYIYEILLEKEELSLRDVQREVKNHQVKETQVQRCFSLLHAQGLVHVKQRDGVEMWSLPSEAQSGLENKTAVSERGDQGTRSKQSDDRRSSWETPGRDRHSSGQTTSRNRRSSRESSNGEVSGQDAHSNLYSSSHNMSGSYADVTKSKTRLTDPTHPTNTTQPTGAECGWPLPSSVTAKKEDPQTTPRHSVRKDGDHVARGGSTKAYSRPGDRSSTPSSQQSLRDSSSANTRSRNTPNESLRSSTPSDSTHSNTTHSNTTHSNTTQSRGAGSVCPQSLPVVRDLVVAKQENTPNSIRKSFSGMEISTTGDMRVAEYTSLNPEEQQYCNIFNKVLQVLKDAGSPVKATEIAKRARVGESKKSVNSALYFLEKKGITKKSSDVCPCWSLVTTEECTDEKIKEYAVEHNSKKNPGADTSLAITSGSPDSRTTDTGKCKTCQGSCVNIEQNTHIHYHQHCTQVGTTNQLIMSQSGEAVEK